MSAPLWQGCDEARSSSLPQTTRPQLPRWLGRPVVPATDPSSRARAPSFCGVKLFASIRITLGADPLPGLATYSPIETARRSKPAITVSTRRLAACPSCQMADHNAPSETSVSRPATRPTAVTDAAAMSDP